MISFSCIGVFYCHVSKKSLDLGMESDIPEWNVQCLSYYHDLEQDGMFVHINWMTTIVFVFLPQFHAIDAIITSLNVAVSMVLLQLQVMRRFQFIISRTRSYRWFLWVLCELSDSLLFFVCSPLIVSRIIF